MRQHDESGAPDRDSDRIVIRGTDSAPDADDEEATQEIRVEIEQTRAEMSGTIDAIQDKLNPERLTEQAKEAVRDAAETAKEAVREATVGKVEHVVESTVEKAEEVLSTAGETAGGIGSTVMETIRANPVPAALAGLSLGWLFMNRPRRRRTYGAYQPATPYAVGRGPSQRRADVGGTTWRYPGQPERSVSYGYEQQSTGGGIADRVGETAGQAQERAAQAVSSAGEMASNVASGATEMASGAVSGAAEMASTVGETAGGLGSDVLGVIRRNPVPAALTGIGLTWLYMNRETGRPPYVARSRDHVWSGSGVRGGYDYRGGDQSQSTVGQMAGQAQRRAGDLAGGVADQAGEYAGWAADQGQWAGRRVQRMLQDNPLMAGALAVTVGSAVGLLLPETRTEDEVLGKARDSLVGQAQAVTQDTVEKVQRVAGEVQTTVQEQAREQGLTT